MGIFSIVKSQKKKRWTKYTNSSSESVNVYQTKNDGCSDDDEERMEKDNENFKVIDLPNGVVLKNSHKKREEANNKTSIVSGKFGKHKYFPKFFHSMFKRKYNEAMEMTKAKWKGKVDGKGKSCGFTCSTCSTCSTMKKTTTAATAAATLYDLNDSEKTFQGNNIQNLDEFYKSNHNQNYPNHHDHEIDNDEEDEDEVEEEEEEEEKSTNKSKSKDKNNKGKNKKKNNNNNNNNKKYTFHGKDMFSKHFNINENECENECENGSHSEYESTVGTVVASGSEDIYGDYNFPRQPIHLNLRNEDTLPVLDEDLAEIIRCRLPKLLQEATQWNLMYSLDQHGASLSTLYKSVNDCGPCVMVLKNSENEVFGAFLSEPFDNRNQGFYGSPECFLWKKTDFEFRKYGATNVNEYFILADPTFIAMGGGNGNFGFYLDDDIQYGYSSKCETFDNDILTQDNEFECYGLEIWNLEF